jgi:peptidoglycan-associated lipoprotein
MKKLAAVLASILVVACASSPNADSSKATKSSGTVVASNTSLDIHSASAPLADAEKAIGSQSTAGESTANVQEPQNKSIYFDFDSFAIIPAYRDEFMQQAEFIKNHKNEVVVLEGNADERGSGEYNLALGDKRATAVRKSLELLGIPASQIRTVSLGKEKPRLSCHEEKCWHENRRVDFVYQNS